MLHIYPQCHEHDDVFIAGSVESLRKLRDAIDQALAETSAACGSITADGEGYAIVVAKTSDEIVGTLVLPYAHLNTLATDPPTDIMEPARYRELVLKVMEEG